MSRFACYKQRFFRFKVFTFYSAWYKVTFESGVFGSNVSFNQEEYDKYILALLVVALPSELNGIQQEQKILNHV